jgi:hypothetical protein
MKTGGYGGRLFWNAEKRAAMGSLWQALQSFQPTVGA